MPVALVVEDEWLVRMEFADALQNAGWEVLEASTGDAALPLLKGTIHIDLLLTDIRLPGSATGWDVAQAFRAADARVAVIYCSGNPPDPARQVEGSIFLPKPCRTDRIIELGRTLCLAAGRGTA